MAAVSRIISSCVALLCLFATAPIRAFDMPIDPWKTEIDQMMAADGARPPVQHGVVFIGSSSIRLWATLAEDFAGIPVVNRGFGGSLLADSTREVARLVTPLHPKAVVVYAGDNDIATNRTPAQVLTDFKGFVARVRQDSPRVPILFIAIKPSIARFMLWPKMREANELISSWAHTRRDVVVVDVTRTMLDASGRPRPELYQSDGLHLGPAGYAILAKGLCTVLARYGFVASSPRAAR